jgi:hypothetical protein
MRNQVWSFSNLVANLGGICFPGVFALRRNSFNLSWNGPCKNVASQCLPMSISDCSDCLNNKKMLMLTLFWGCSSKALIHKVVVEE